MSIFAHNSLIRYTTPPNNYIGSALFLSYIIAALCLTSTIGYSLYTQYTNVFHSHPSSPPSKFRQNGAGKVETRSARARHIKIYTILALVSFASISWHMLGFLITSFLDWNNSSTRSIVAVLGNNAFDKLRRWMLETGLFNDFAVQLVGDGESAVWAQLAILATWFWNLWMAGKGRQYGFTAKTMIPFIILGQNLPISLTAALFIIQLHLAAPDVTGNNKERTQTHAQPKQSPVASLMLPTIILNAILLAQPSLREHSGFSYLVLGERLLLLLPHTGLLKLNDADIKKSIAISGGFVVANWAMLRKDTSVQDVLTALVYKNQAVKTMGWDAALGVVVYGALSWGGGV
ncbi:uncharacterized protein EKO05_0010605 [Ascochyta rabiei]|uniref:Uncharacterized protein n=1 Tax=Didymella rabiei TaxID=5454 RepID=A0A162ZK23_DIDRA|nr:uncharacterized protein EKO05_0010605 [Ascochyta rabiei]KZM20649.1 hypothetical protein ST47_g8194 [Ascochyta rabiei]UPX20371.1 hypothetical protein EKO05_0010605 [Ascochyta rabiei]